MAEVSGLVIAGVRVLQMWRGALDTVSTKDSHEGLLNRYSLSMHVFEESLNTLQGLDESNEAITTATEKAVMQCNAIGYDLAKRQERVAGSNRKAVLAPWKFLREEHQDFERSVNVFHALVQRFVIRGLILNQGKSLMRNLVARCYGS